MSFDRFASWIVGDYKIRRQKITGGTRYSITKNGEWVATKATLVAARKWIKGQAAPVSNSQLEIPFRNELRAADYPAE